MKSSLKTLTLLLFFLSLMTFSCGKDEEPETDPLCSNIQCNNGGICVSGICDCPSNYEGPNCDIPITPIAVKLIQVIVKNFPTTDAFGSGWDIDSKADISFRILNNNEVLYTHVSFVENANPDDDHLFSVNDLTFTAVKAEYVIQLLDDDGADPADIIDTYTFTVYNDSNGFPGLLELRGGSSQMDLTLEYIH